MTLTMGNTWVLYSVHDTSLYAPLFGVIQNNTADDLESMRYLSVECKFCCNRGISNVQRSIDEVWCLHFDSVYKEALGKNDRNLDSIVNSPGDSKQDHYKSIADTGIQLMNLKCEILSPIMNNIRFSGIGNKDNRFTFCCIEVMDVLILNPSRF